MCMRSCLRCVVLTNPLLHMQACALTMYMCACMPTSEMRVHRNRGMQNIYENCAQKHGGANSSTSHFSCHTPVIQHFPNCSPSLSSPTTNASFHLNYIQNNSMASDSDDRSDLSSNYSGSDYSSDDGEPSLEQPDAQPAAASHPGTSDASSPSMPVRNVPRLGVPSLALGQRPQEQAPAAMMTARPGAPPLVPALTARQPEAQPMDSKQQITSAVHLVSYAFSLDNVPSSDADLRSVRARCVKALGVAEEELTLFELRAAGSTGAPSIGVAINNSSMRGFRFFLVGCFCVVCEFLCSAHKA